MGMRQSDQLIQLIRRHCRDSAGGRIIRIGFCASGRPRSQRTVCQQLQGTENQHVVERRLVFISGNDLMKQDPSACTAAQPAPASGLLPAIADKPTGSIRSMFRWSHHWNAPSLTPTFRRRFHRQRQPCFNVFNRKRRIHNSFSLCIAFSRKMPVGWPLESTSIQPSCGRVIVPVSPKRSKSAGIHAGDMPACPASKPPAPTCLCGPDPIGLKSGLLKEK